MRNILSIYIFMKLIFVSGYSYAFEDTYKLGAGDKIQISVYGEENLSIEELHINNSGKFDYPYLGQLTVINKTPEQLKSEITKGLKGDYLISPKVSCNHYRLQKYLC